MLGVVSGRLEFKLGDVFFHAYSYREKACLSNLSFRFNEIKFRSLFMNLTPLFGVFNISIYYIIIRCPWNTDLLLLSAPSYMCSCLSGTCEATVIQLLYSLRQQKCPSGGITLVPRK